MQPAPPEIAVRLDTWQQKVRLAAGLLTLLAICAGFFYAATTTADTTAKRTGAWVVLALFVVLTVLIAGGGVLAVRRQSLVLSAAGIRRDVARGNRWTVAWSDLARVCVHRGYTVTDRRLVFSGSGRNRPRVWDVWVELVPAAGVPVERFAGLKPYRGLFDTAPEAYGVWLGPVHEVAAHRDEAVHAYAAQAYVPMCEEGDLRGRTLLRRRRR